MPVLIVHAVDFALAIGLCLLVVRARRQAREERHYPARRLARELGRMVDEGAHLTFFWSHSSHEPGLHVIVDTIARPTDVYMLLRLGFSSHLGEQNPDTVSRVFALDRQEFFAALVEALGPDDG